MKTFEFTISGNTYEVEIKKFEENIAKIEVNGTPYKVEVHRKIPTSKTPTLIRKPIPDTGPGEIKRQEAGVYKVISPLPGIIIQMNVKVGDTIRKGQSILIMEAMKMENSINAEKDGVVTRILKSTGDSVLQGDLLIEADLMG
jgi:glutaconyl-CoA/methylmalonyl-CoA decarboxylase subunit gamma